jgi:hypothetical protein
MATDTAAGPLSQSAASPFCSARENPRTGWRKKLQTAGMESAMATVKSYDQRCYDLAMEFLKDESDLFSALHVHLLALEIQQTIEDEIYFMREHPELYPLLNATALSSQQSATQEIRNDQG